MVADLLGGEDNDSASAGFSGVFEGAVFGCAAAGYFHDAFDSVPGISFPWNIALHCHWVILFDLWRGKNKYLCQFKLNNNFIITIHTYTPRTLRVCCSQSKFRILKICKSSARALFLYNCTPNISRSADARVRVGLFSKRVICISLVISKWHLNLLKCLIYHIIKDRKVCLCCVWIRLTTVYLLCAQKFRQNNALALQFWCLSNALTLQICAFDESKSQRVTRVHYFV